MHLLPDSEQQPLKQSGSPATTSKNTALHEPRRLRWHSIPWKLEILSWIGSLCFFVATIIVLRVLDGRPIPELSFGITPNAIIGLLATFAEFLLIVPVNSAIGQIKWLQALRRRPMDDFRAIDEASRGPMGSVMLLARRKGGPVASFGALVTIIALGTSTFFQQALKYNTIYPHSDDALMPIAQYMNGSGWATLGAFGGGGATSGVDTELLAAPYVALFSPAHTNFTATAHCSTNNCTWESYQTLGICSTCESLTSSLKMSKVHIVPDEQVDLAYDTDYYTLPNGFGLTGIQPVGMINQINVETNNAMLNITTSITGRYRSSMSDVWDSIAFAHNGSKLFSVFAVGPSPGTLPTQIDANYSGNMTGGIFAPPIAFECLLQLCIRNMRAQFVNGKLIETEVSRWTNQSQPSSDSSNNPEVTLRSPNASTTFVATGEAMGGTSNWLSQLLVGNATSNRINSAWQVVTPDYSSALIQAIHKGMNRSTTAFPDLMDNLANSLSLNLRATPYQPSPVHGSAYCSASHATVTWEWLILPLFELIGSLVFLIAVVVETRKRDMVPWANNILAYFFHGLDERPLGKHLCETQDTMQAEARELMIEFQSDNRGCGLVIAEP